MRYQMGQGVFFGPFSFGRGLDTLIVEITLCAGEETMFSIILTVAFLGLNLYGAWVSYQRKQWMWFGISLALALYCGSSLLPFLL
jgi:hypothetical protein